MEYNRRVQAVLIALRKHCFDGKYLSKLSTGPAEFAVICCSNPPPDAAGAPESAFNDERVQVF